MFTRPYIQSLHPTGSQADHVHLDQAQGPLSETNATLPTAHSRYPHTSDSLNFYVLRSSLLDHSIKMADSGREQIDGGKTAADMRLDEIMVRTESDAALVGRWLTDTIGNPEYTNKETLCDQIDTGVTLALIINKLFPNQNVKVTSNAQHGSLQARGNLVNVISACTALGIHESIVFAADDLVQKRNIDTVFNTLVSLKKLADKPVQPAGGKESDAETTSEEKAATTETAVDEACSINVPAAEAQLAEVPVVEPAERQPARQQPAEAEEAQAEGAHVERALVEEVAVEEPAMEEAAVEEAAVEEAVVEDAAVDEAPADEAPAEEPVVEEASVGEVHQENVNGEEAPAEELLAEETHDGEEPVHKDVSNDAPIHDELKNITEAELMSRIKKLDVSIDVRKTIAEIVSNSEETYVVLDDKNICDMEAVLIGDGLRRNDTLKYLYLSENNIGDIGATSIGEGLRTNAALEELHLNENNIGDIGAASIGEALRTNDALQILVLKQNNISDTGAGAIGEGLRSNASLESLYLDGNNITCDGYLALAKGFRWSPAVRILDATPEGTEYIKDKDTKQLKEIGRGEFGTVWLASIKGGVEVVEKKAHGAGKREGIFERLMLKGLPEHRNIVRIAALSYTDSLLLEAHKGGSLKEYAKSQEDGTPLPKFLSYSHGMCLAIEHLHKYGVIHRDIALRNYVLTDDLETPVLVDFGLAWPLLEEKFVDIRSTEMMPFRQCAPEVLSALRYSKGSDIWQLGLAMWQLLQRGRQAFFQFVNDRELLEYLHKKMVQEDKHIPLSFKKNGATRALINTIKHIVVFCCTFDPEKRPTATQVVREIDSLRESVDGAANEEKSISTYEPSDSHIDSGLMAYNYTEYQNLNTEGRRDYLDLKKEREEHEYGHLETLGEVNQDEEGGDWQGD